MVLELISVGQAVLDLLIKTCKILFWRISLRASWLPKISMSFLSFSHNWLQDVCANYGSIFSKLLIILRWCTKHAQSWFYMKLPLRVSDYCFDQGSETSGRNRFLPGRMEETGKKVFLPVSSGRKWKKVEETGRNTWSQIKIQTCGNKFPDTVK